MGALEEDHVESAQVEALEQKQDQSGVEATHSDDHDAKGMEKEPFHVTSASTVSGDGSSLEVNVKGVEQAGDITHNSDSLLSVPDSSGLETSELENSSADLPPVAAESLSVAKETGSVDSIVEVEEPAPETQQAEANLVKEDIDGVSCKEEPPKNTEEVDENFDVVTEDIDAGSLVQEVQDGASNESVEEAEKAESVNEEPSQVVSGISSDDPDETAEILEGDKEEVRVAEEDVEDEVTAAPEDAADSSSEVKLQQEEDKPVNKVLEEETSSALVTGDEAEHAADAVTEVDDVATELEALEVEEEAKVTAEDDEAETKVPDSTIELQAGEQNSVADVVEATQLAESDATQEDGKLADEESAGNDSEVLEKEASRDLESVAETGKGTEDAEQDEGAEATMEETKIKNPDHGTGEAVDTNVSEGEGDGLITDETVAEGILSEEANEAAEADKESQLVFAADEAVAVSSSKEEEEDDSKAEAFEETGKDTEDENIDISSEAMDDSRDVGTTGLNAEQEGDREVLDETAAPEENPKADIDNLESENGIDEVIEEGTDADEAQAVENAEDIGQTVTGKALLEMQNKAEEAVDTDKVTGSGEDVDVQTIEAAIPNSVEETTTQNVAGEEVATNQEAASDAPEIVSKEDDACDEQVDIVSAALFSPDAGDVEEKNIAAPNVEDVNADEGAAVSKVTDSNVNEALETESSIPDAGETVEEAGKATKDGEDVAVGSSEHAEVEATRDSEDVTEEVSADSIDVEVRASSSEQDEGAEAIPTEEMQVENVGDGTGDSVVSEGLVTDKDTREEVTVAKFTTPDEAGTVGEELETNSSIEDGVANSEEPEAAVSSALPAETDGVEVPRDVQIDEGKTEATTLIEAPGEDKAAATDELGEIDAPESPEAINSVEDAMTTEADHVSLTAEGEDGSVEAAEVDATSVVPDETTKQGDARAEDSFHIRAFVVDQAKEETEEQAEANNEDNYPEAEASIGSPGLEDNSEIEQAEAAGLENDSSHGVDNDNVTRDFVVDQAMQATEEHAEANNDPEAEANNDPEAEANNDPEAEASIGSAGLEDNNEIVENNNLTEQAEAIAEESSPEAEASTEDSSPELENNNTTEQAEEDVNNETEQAETITEDSNLTEQAEASTENVSTGLEDSNVTGDLEVEATMDEDHKSSEEAIEQSNEDDNITRDFVADQVFEAEEASPGDQKLSEEDDELSVSQGISEAVEEAEKTEEGLTRGGEAKEDDSQSASDEQAGDSTTDENAKVEESPVTVEKIGEDKTVSEQAEEAPAADERSITEDNVVEQTDEACVTEPAAAKTGEVHGDSTVPKVTEEAEVVRDVDHDPSLSKDEGARTRIASAFDSIVNAAMHLAKATKPSKKKRLRLKKELKKQLLAA